MIKGFWSFRYDTKHKRSQIYTKLEENDGRKSSLKILLAKGAVVLRIEENNFMKIIFSKYNVLSHSPENIAL